MVEGGLPIIGLALGEREREEERDTVQMNIDSEDEGGQEDEGGGDPEEVEENEEGRKVEGRILHTKRKQNKLKHQARADKRRRQAVEKRMREINEEAIVEI